MKNTLSNWSHCSEFLTIFLLHRWWRRWFMIVFIICRDQIEEPKKKMEASGKRVQKRERERERERGSKKGLRQREQGPNLQRNYSIDLTLRNILSILIGGKFWVANQSALKIISVKFMLKNSAQIGLLLFRPWWVIFFQKQPKY